MIRPAEAGWRAGGPQRGRHTAHRDWQESCSAHTRIFGDSASAAGAMASAVEAEDARYRG